MQPIDRDALVFVADALLELYRRLETSHEEAFALLRNQKAQTADQQKDPAPQQQPQQPSNDPPAKGGEEQECWRSERDGWREMPFFKVAGDTIVDHWCPGQVQSASEDNRYSDQCALGTAYAMRLIEHLIEYPAFDPGAGLASAPARQVGGLAFTMEMANG